MADDQSRELLKKADKGVKTAESWWSFCKAIWEEAKTPILSVLGGSGVIGAALGDIGNWFTIYGWAGIVLAAVAGIIVACVVTAAVIGVGHALIGIKERRMRNNHLSSNDSIPSNSLSPTMRIEDVNRVLGESVQVTNSNFEHVYAEIKKASLIAARLDVVEGELRKLLRAPQVTEPKNLDDLDSAVQKVSHDLGAVSVKFTEMIGDLRADFQALEGRTVRVFRAKQVETRMDDLLAQIETLSDALSAPTLRGTEDVDLVKWKEGYRDWQRLLDELTNTVIPYFQIESRLKTINPDQLKDEGWSFPKDCFPDTGLIHDYKMFRLVLRNFEILKQPMTVAVRRESIV